MVKLVSAKCPSCGSSLKLSNDEEKTKCEYCNNTIIVEDAIACFKLKVSGNVGVEGISTNAELIDAANELLDMNEYLKAKRKFLEFSEKCPDNYQGWLGLLICRTRNFTIKDNNIMFENDVNKYYEHFLRVAPDDIKEQYFETIDRYFDPDKYIRLENQEKMMKLKQELENKLKQDEEKKTREKEEREKKKSERLNDIKKKKDEIFNNMEKAKNNIINDSNVKALNDFGKKGLELFFAACNGCLYCIGGLFVLAFLLSFDSFHFSDLFLLLFGLSLFKCFYSLFEKKVKTFEHKRVIVARFILPFVFLVMFGMFVPGEDNVPDNNVSENNIVEKTESIND